MALISPAVSDWPASWSSTLLGAPLPAEGGSLAVAGQRFVLRHGILRAEGLSSDTQSQTADAFGYKWQHQDIFDHPILLPAIADWLHERYGDPAQMPWLTQADEPPLFVDAGCGTGVGAFALFGSWLRRVRYLGVDISPAVDVIATHFAEHDIPGAFLQCDLTQLPLLDASVDVVFSEGVMHHTDSTRAALLALARLLRPGGVFLFYVYRRKGPIREFTDDYIRDALAPLPPAAAWDALLPLTKLGQKLGELNVEIELDEPIDLLQIPAGRHNLQRLFYWHVFKAYYRAGLTLDEMNHVNFDWFAPRNAHRQSAEDVRGWCAEAGLTIEREHVEDAGITVIARKDPVR